MCAVPCCFCVFCGGEGNAHAACWVRDGFSKETDVGFFNGESLSHTVERDPCGVDTTVDDGRRTGEVSVTSIGRPSMARAWSSNSEKRWVARVTRPVSWGRGETSEK